MTNHQELSEELAGLLGIEAKTHGLSSWDRGCWLTQDKAWMFELMVKKGVILEYMHRFVRAISDFTDMTEAHEFYEAHPNKTEATCIAIARAIIAKLENQDV